MLVHAVYITEFDGIRRLKGLYTTKKAAEDRINEFQITYDPRGLMMYEMVDYRLDAALDSRM